MASGDVETPEQIRRDEAQAAIAAERRNLTALGRYVAESSLLGEVGADLAASTPLVVVGTRVSESLARYFTYAAQRIHPDVRLITHGGTASLDALALRRRDHRRAARRARLRTARRGRH
jgi:DNA-binding MurR/RpiR family transcriptional regulator